MPKPNDRIGPYTLISKLGRGAFGVVWLAEKRTAITTTKVAIKIPHDEDIDLEAIKQEASLWVHASGHPNVLPMIDADIYEEQVIIVSEYAPDGSLSKWLTRHGGKAPSVESATAMMLGILSGLGHLHRRGIIHRDLKPDNILLQNETPRLADFGIARILKTTSKSTTVTGTPSYMPPEAFDGRRSERTDIWSAGVIFYQLLSGRLPFPEEEFTSLVGAILGREPAPLPDFIPRPLQEIVGRALKKTPSERFGSADEMQQALRTAAAQKGGPARGTEPYAPATPPPPEKRSPKIEPRPAATPPRRGNIKRRGTNWTVLAVIGLALAVVASVVVRVVVNRSSPGSDDNTVRAPSANALPLSAADKSSPSPAATAEPSPAAATVQVRLTQIEHGPPDNVDVLDNPITDSNIIIEAGGKTFNKFTNRDGVVVFDAVPCGGEIAITAYSRLDNKDVTFRKSLGCDQDPADLGVIDLVCSKTRIEQRKVQPMVYDANPGTGWSYTDGRGVVSERELKKALALGCN